jgi:hypothetical protein
MMPRLVSLSRSDDPDLEDRDELEGDADDEWEYEGDEGIVSVPCSWHTWVSIAPNIHFLKNVFMPPSATAIAAITSVLALLYLSALFYSYSHSHRPINKLSGLRLQRYAPVVYAFNVLTSLAEVATPHVSSFSPDPPS